MRHLLIAASLLAIAAPAVARAQNAPPPSDEWTPIGDDAAAHDQAAEDDSAYPDDRATGDRARLPDDIPRDRAFGDISDPEYRARLHRKVDALIDQMNALAAQAAALEPVLRRTMAELERTMADTTRRLERDYRGRGPDWGD